MKQPVRYIAEPKHVEEVSLRGTADLPFWQDRLEREYLVPLAREGKAQVLVVGARIKFMGNRFTEIGFSIMASAIGDSEGDFFLVQAFNSFRFFAFCEEKLFKTPYAHADCRLTISPWPSLQVLLGRETVFDVGMQGSAVAGPRQKLQTSHECWAGRVFLPRSRRSDRTGRYFFARMKGRTDTYPFAHGKDRFQSNAGAGIPILQALSDSHFAIEQWMIRDDATHGKSKTYRRNFNDENRQQ